MLQHGITESQFSLVLFSHSFQADGMSVVLITDISDYNIFHIIIELNRLDRHKGSTSST